MSLSSSKRSEKQTRLPKPYYQAHGITIYHGDALTILPLIDPSTVDLLLTDPPYGINYRTSSSRGLAVGGIAPSCDWDPIVGDDEPFDPTPLLRFPRLALFGANYYAHRLPVSPSWIVWDKVDGLPSKRDIGFNNGADGELVWTNLGGPLRILHHRWMGLMKGSEHGQRRCHPTQKPIELMAQIIDWRTEASQLILDPYMGSGPIELAAYRLGRKCIGIEIEERFCEVAARRLDVYVRTL